MKRFLLLSILSISLQNKISAQCTATIPSTAQHGSGTISVFEGEFWACDGDVLTVNKYGYFGHFFLGSGSSLNITAEDGQGSIYVRSGATLTISNNSSFSVYHESGATVNKTDPDTRNTYTACSAISFSYSLAPGSSCLSTGISEIAADKGPLIFPNPASTEVNIMNAKDQAISYLISNHLGQNVSSGKLDPGSNKISTEHFSSGVYFMEIDGKRSKFTIE